MLVFRDGRKTVPSAALLRLLSADLEEARRAPEAAAPQRLLHALIRAGEVESAFADATEADPARANAAALAEQLTDALAEGLLGNHDAWRAAEPERALLCSPFAGRVSTSPHEGFAYYALHPLAFADLAHRAARRGDARAQIVGIRSIGATLSAVVAAALRSRGLAARRLTVRPRGHPYARALAFLPDAQAAIEGANGERAEFFVVDEGPGLSGSTFLAVGEALRARGVPPERITFLGSRAVEPSQLLAHDAAVRWSRFRMLAATSPPRLPARTGTTGRTGARPLAGGEWRELVYEDPEDWPASWTAFERPKLVDAPSGRILKFEGLGPYGATAFARALALAEAGWGPEVSDEGEGFLGYALAGPPLAARDLDEGVLERLAEYCAARLALFPAASASDTEDSQVIAMLRTNVLEEFGLEVPDTWEPAVERPVHADARMLPHEWVRSASGQLVKVDAVGHGDDHFMPGPTDIAWDLAGTIVEWALDRAARERFLAVYRRASGDDPRARLDPYVRAYAVFRMAYCKMAAAALGPGPEAERLTAAYRRYRRAVESEGVSPKAPRAR
jgi:hypothetical protein